MKRKLIVIGDYGCGKTCLLSTFRTNEFPNSVPNISDTYSTKMEIDSQEITVELCDTAGGEDYDLIRPLYYQDVNVLLVCFSINSQVSLRNIKEKWSPEINRYVSRVPFILVGNKQDLRNNPETTELVKVANSHLVSVQEGEKTAKKILVLIATWYVRQSYW